MWVFGSLHLEIITERLKENRCKPNYHNSEHYKVHTTKQKVLDLQNPSNMPDPSQIEKIEEPWIKSTIITPDEYLGSILKFVRTKEVFKQIYLIRGIEQYSHMTYLLMRLFLILT